MKRSSSVEVPASIPIFSSFLFCSYDVIESLFFYNDVLSSASIDFLDLTSWHHQFHTSLLIRAT